MLEQVAERLRAQAAAFTGSSGVPGYLAGVYHNGDQVTVAHGLANVDTRAPMAEDTGFLLGSITKVLTTTLILRQVERGLIDLDERVAAYLPEFTLVPPAAAAEIRVRNLLTHTDGIDADLFFPEARGRDALKVYVEQLGRHCGTLFAPGEYMSYSNAAFSVAGRLLETVTGEYFHDLLERDIYQVAGMTESCTSAEQAILRRTAVGHFYDPAAGAVRRTELFMLPDSWASAGSSPIVTIGDLLAFARAHLAGGHAPSGERLLSQELTERMRTPHFDMGMPNATPIGLGWMLVPFGETTVLWHGGGSPGGTSQLIVVPEHDLAFAAFGNDSRAGALHEELTSWLLRDYLGLKAPNVAWEAVEPSDLTRYEGTYRSNQLRIDITAVDGQLEQAVTLEPFDATQERILRQFTGGLWPFPPQRLVPVGDGLFAPAGVPPEALTSIRGRHALVSFHGDVGGRPAHRASGGKLPRRSPDL